MRYREISPPPAFAASIECLWRLDPGDRGFHRVTPDGCADIVFSNAGAVAVGAMTAFQDVASQGVSMGVRFHPGMWARYFRIEAAALTDRTMALEKWSIPETLEELARMVEGAWQPVEPTTAFERALQWAREMHGAVSMDQMAAQCNLSARQLRRVSLERTGLTPKFLMRVLRFRHAASRLRSAGGAHLAAECGYYDQAHLIHEFREFAGRTPAMSVFSNL